MHISKSAHEYVFIYSVSSLIYTLTELIYRGHTHFTMVLLGGISGATIHLINKLFYKRSIFLKALLSAASVTALEYTAGIILNIILGWQVWDYSDRFLNLHGQICPLFSFYWFLIAFPSLGLSYFTISFIRKYGSALFKKNIY